MARGKNRQYVVNGDKQVGYGSQATWDFIYEASTTKNPLYNLGDKVTLPDDREFRYAKALTEVHAAHGCEQTYTGLISYTSFVVAASAGDREITVPAATHAALTKDQLRGGMVIIFDGSDDSNTTTRGILGNDASDADVAFKLYLDAKIHAAITTTNAIEVYRNEWEALQDGSSATNAKMGVPAVNATALQYFWVQTKGKTWIAPQGTVIGNEGMGVYWRHDGSLEAAATALGATVPDADSTQLAGHLVIGNYSGNGPIVYLNG